MIPAVDSHVIKFIVTLWFLLCQVFIKFQ